MGMQSDTRAQAMFSKDHETERHHRRVIETASASILIKNTFYHRDDWEISAFREETGKELGERKT